MNHGQYDYNHGNRGHPQQHANGINRNSQFQSQLQQQQPQDQIQYALPPGWVEATDPSTMKTYYCNPQTQETNWERPTVVTTPTIRTVASTRNQGNSTAIFGNPSSSDETVLRQEQQPLPPGWVEAKDPKSGRIYYCNPQTRETKWGRPISSAATPSVHSISHENVVGATGKEAYKNQGKDIGTNKFASQDLKQKKSLLNAATTAKTPAAATNKSSDLDSHEEANHFDELKAMTAGQIAHLTKLQQQNHKAQRLDQSEEERQVGISTLVSNRSSHNSNENDKNTISDLSKYTPIELSLMSSLSSMERTEPGRLDVRMYALREELKKFGYEQSPIQQQHL